MEDNTNKEKLIKDSIYPVSIDVTRKIVEQMEKSICKIQINGEIGTGFFTKIPYKQLYLKCLITNNHIIGKKEIENGRQVSISLNNEKKRTIIEINEKKRKIYTSKHYDVTIIEILEDIDGKYEYIELNDEIKKVMHLNEDEIINYYRNNYKKESIYILNYMKGENIVVSYGLLHEIKSDNELAHKCCTDNGSSGSPILSLKDNKLIGIHYGSSKHFDSNKGTLIIFPLIEFNQKIFNNISDNIDSNINKKKGNNNLYNINYYNNKNIKDFNNNNYFDNIKNIDNTEINKLNEITIQYDVKNNDKIKLFGKKFIENNKNNCKIRVDNKVYNIVESIKVNRNINRDIIEIKLIIEKKMTNISYMFGDSINNGCNALISLPDICNLDTKDVTNMSSLFIGCNSLFLISDISKWDTESVTDMSSMFYHCKSLKSLPDISKWNTSNVTNMSNMFSYCISLSRLPDISKWNTEKVTNMSSLFNNCNKLIKLPDISRWNTSKVTDMSFMFNYCIKIVIFPDISNWNTSNLTDMNCIFNDCKVKPDISRWDLRNIKDINDDII